MAVLKMQRLGICAWKKNRKQILELLQRRGVLDIDTDAAEDEVFKKTDTSEARGDFERDIQLIEHALSQSGEEDGRRIFIVEDAEQIARLRVSGSAAFCTVTDTGEIQYFKQKQEELY